MNLAFWAETICQSTNITAVSSYATAWTRSEWQNDEFILVVRENTFPVTFRTTVGGSYAQNVLTLRVNGMAD